MAEKSYYEVTCICGKVNKPHERVSRCESCGRTLELHWPADPNAIPRAAVSEPTAFEPSNGPGATD